MSVYREVKYVSLNFGAIEHVFQFGDKTIISNSEQAKTMSNSSFVDKRLHVVQSLSIIHHAFKEKRMKTQAMNLSHESMWNTL